MNTPTRRLTLALVLALTAGLAQAGPYMGGRGYHHHHHHGGGGRAWIAPAIIGGALLATAIAAPAYSYPVPAPVVTYGPSVQVYGTTYGTPYGTPMMAPPVGYYCPTSGQFYPYVPTCNVPWQLM